MQIGMRNTVRRDQQQRDAVDAQLPFEAREERHALRNCHCAPPTRIGPQTMPRTNRPALPPARSARALISEETAMAPTSGTASMSERIGKPVIVRALSLMPLMQPR
jgi:hypothetical protein